MSHGSAPRATTAPHMAANVFPGHGNRCVLDMASGEVAFRGHALVAPDGFFLNAVSLVTSGVSTHASHHTLRDEHGVRVFGSTVPLADNMCRQLCIEAHARRVRIESIRWLGALPDLDALHGVVHLRLADLDITTLPSLFPLVNLLELQLVRLLEMRELPDAICDAPKLCTLQLGMLLRLHAVPDAFVRRLAAKAAPLRVLGMARCACEVPAGIGMLTGLHSLRLEDRAARLDDPRAPPSRLPDLSGLTCLRTLAIELYPLVGLHEEQAALPSLTTFSYTDRACDHRTPYRRDGERLTAFIAGCVSLVTLTVHRYGLRKNAPGARRALQMQAAGKAVILSLPAHLGGLRALQTLTLQGLYITGLGDDIAALASLVSLKVVDCPRLRRFGPSILRGCTRLRHLTLDFNSNPMACIVCWHVVVCVPDMRQLETLVVLNTGVSPVDGTRATQALVDALRCWPPRCVTTAIFDREFCRYWESYGLGEPASERWDVLEPEDKSRHLVPVLRGWWQSREQLAVALAMGLHTRLGAASVLLSLDSELACMLFTELRARQIKDFDATWGAHVGNACLPMDSDSSASSGADSGADSDSD